MNPRNKSFENWRIESKRIHGFTKRILVFTNLLYDSRILTKSSTLTAKENKIEMGKEDVQETAGENKSKMVEEAELEEVYQAIQSLVASGMSIKAKEEFFLRMRDSYTNPYESKRIE